MHHAVLYVCYHDLGDWGHPDDQGHICYERGMPLDSCSIMILAWAVGGEVGIISSVENRALSLIEHYIMGQTSEDICSKNLRIFLCLFMLYLKDIK